MNMKKYEALRVSHIHTYEVQGQRSTDYNWETILRFDNEETAIQYAKQVRDFLLNTTGRKLIIWKNAYEVE